MEHPSPSPSPLTPHPAQALDPHPSPLTRTKVLLNEIAPRPHNSGHYTMNACYTDQFEQHLRAVLDLPLGSVAMNVPHAAMLNIIGSPDGSLQTTLAPVNRALTLPNTAVHWYGKSPAKAKRKMGHVNVTACTASEAASILALLEATLDGGSDTATAEVMPAAGGPSSVPSATDLPANTGATVGVIMGSDSDLPCMRAACEVLEQFGVAYEVTIVSAHRTPARLFEYAQQAGSRGLQVVIAGAGGAAHLPGMVAALTPLPVIGVPVKSSALSGNDSLLSIVQMPRGVPVATVAIGNAANAGLLAVRMLGMADMRLREAMASFMSEQETEVLHKAARLEKEGYRGYAPP
mmetsp:Transcript_70786/g.140292  ORF Transcript_70786/g.140292 Transcript_70786/m.140292 type:complete len:348 (+) Transcript_70786:770-1813(+)